MCVFLLYVLTNVYTDVIIYIERQKRNGGNKNEKFTRNSIKNGDRNKKKNA